MSCRKQLWGLTPQDPAPGCGRAPASSPTASLPLRYTQHHLRVNSHLVRTERKSESLCCKSYCHLDCEAWGPELLRITPGEPGVAAGQLGRGAAGSTGF